MSYQKLQANRAAAVTPSDTTNIPSLSSESGTPNRGCVLYIGTGGDLKVLTVGGDEVVFSNIPDGTFLPVQVVRVLNSDTTAYKIIALW
ncbi:hypothetical protein elemo19C_phanotate67 [Flavobacterium phage vB_FspP_elemoA_1-9C]|jgi:hypothetical protein|uniref:Uncharacterized protein n=6 Tax=Elemovirus TaxID=2948694 RepID=A0A7D7FHI0_9CAUD|nr:tail fiber protein [Flavobacterium phage vB_FspP_elemoA_7-9A]YP_010108972.1 tail fiber protein [Flavobacterium phage vB_FspP_elemoF_6-3D]YP_010109060.1 tail fiber protein [Flavobacterium phage vB_FspP_elemoE_6-9C]YP_010109092.1 tail fiber protein [Flavobacterium phage vB_FspP_elemoD_13-5B]YP_010356146.1 tail fiber protein [Flavobacterium phage vB_FspP_elemoB_14-3B]YP_010356505.1 tail fiber protein [Flavobacterium phage vB_FspP_elemoC_14-1A]QMP84686.1 hypothetical protein elemo131A_phanotat